MHLIQKEKICIYRNKMKKKKEYTYRIIKKKIKLSDLID